ncbi:MAG: DNA internalization-related competence protein ComEC/Rec2 [Actinobacteria bacterium]|nr:MAG: DNA internalization-related competence protein ComEC/Rec2 [Actinomycetota bacterium]
MKGEPGGRRQCERPTLPPVAWLAVAAWVGAMSGEHVSWGIVTGDPASMQAAMSAVALVAALCFLVLRRRRVGRFDPAATAVALVLAGVMVGGTASMLQGASWRSRTRGLADAGAREWVGMVTADPREGAFGPGIRVRITEGPFRGAVLSVWLSGDDPVPEYGRIVRFSAIPKLREHDDVGRRAARGGEHATASAWSVTDVGWPSGALGRLFAWRVAAVERLQVVRGDPGALLRGVVLGDRRSLSGSAVDEDFRVLGLSHVVAVSGSHLAVVCGVVLALGARLRLPRRTLLFAVVTVAAGYTALTGMALSAVRSAVMLVFGAAGECLGIRRDGIAALCVAVVALTVASPWCVFDVGLALSVIAVAGLLLFGDLGIEWVAAAFADRLPKVTSLLGATLVAQACTLPIVVGTFGMLSLAAPIANLVVVPPAEIAICTGLGGAALGGLWPAAGSVVIRVAGGILAFVTRSASLLASLPGAAVSVGSPGIIAIVGGACAVAWLWARWPRPGSVAAARVCLAAVLFANLATGVGPRGPARCEVVVMDVGQGDAILVRDGSHAMLVDVGANAGALRQALARAGVRALDSVVLTHDHDDHIGGYSGLAGVVRVGWVGLPQAAGPEGFSAVRAATPRLTPRGKVATTPLHAGDRWFVGRAEVIVLWPPETPSEALKTNDTSIVLAVRCGGFSCVLTGDAEEAAQSGMLELGGMLRTDVLKVPHHGSRNGLTADGLAAWHPRDAIVSVGAGNDFGHPSPETIELLGRAGVRIWRTDQCGDVRIEVTGNGYRVEPARRVGARRACATIGLSQYARFGPSLQPPFHTKEHDGRFESRSTSAGLPDLRQRRAVARARPPPPSRHGRSGG